MNQNDDDVDPNTMREHFRKLFDELYAKKPKKGARSELARGSTTQRNRQRRRRTNVAKHKGDRYGRQINISN
jgi:hypothetical protein